MEVDKRIRGMRKKRSMTLEELAKRLKISKEDIRLLKLYNMLPVT